MTKTWRVCAAVGLPVLMAGEAPLGGGLPERLHRVPRLPGGQQATVEGAVVFVKPWEGADFPVHPMIQQEWLEFSTEVEVDSSEMAAEAAAERVGVVLDDLSFRMDVPLAISQLECVDVTRPVNAGDEREMLLFPYPNGYPSWRFSRSAALGHVAAEQQVVLKESYRPFTGRDRRAMDWYLKAVNTPFESDQFMFLWIALEVLLDGDEDAQVKGPLITRCQHEIAECPTCGEPTSRMVRGLSLASYLRKHGASEADASILWEVRQVMHGRGHLDREGVADLPRQVQVLRASVTRALKVRLGIPAVQAPVVSATAMSIRPEVALGGRRSLEERELSKTS